MELLLWRWSTAVQAASALMIAIFFIVLSHTISRRELRLWKRAWLANLVAIAVTLVFWNVTPPPWLLPFVRGAYLGAKMAFAVLLVEGAWASRHLGLTMLPRMRRNVIIGVYALAGGFLLNTIPRLGVVQHCLMGALFLGASVASFRVRERGMKWMAAAFFIRGGMAAIEAAAYAIRTLPAGSRSDLYDAAGFVIATSSSWDVGAEWLIALGCLLVMSDRIQTDLRKTNDELLATQDELRALADRDPLTGLSNRRTLPKVFRVIHGSGAKLLFFDLDGFKQINDVMGHHEGDRALQRFANALRSCFRPDDGIVRYAGDEFLVVAAGLGDDALDERLDVLRQKLLEPSLEGPQVRFSVGITDVLPGQKGEDALKLADEAMYERKQRKKRERATA